MAGYSETPLAKKLGIKEGFRVALIGAPKGFRSELEGLPGKVEFLTSVETALDLILFFAKTRSELLGNFSRLAARLAPAGMLWIAWPKKASGVRTDLSDGIVRQIGLDAGLVDTKVCAVNEVWSGLKFVIRVKDRPKTHQGKREPASIAVGLRVKSGRAVALVLAGTANSPRIIARREIQLCDSSVPDSMQPYHAALEMPPKKAAKVIERLVRVVQQATNDSVAELLKENSKPGLKIKNAALVVGSLIDPSAIANDHIRAHALEGQLFRVSVQKALRSHGLSTVEITERDVYSTAAAALARSEDELKRAVSELGRAVAGPWRADEKTAALAAWMALQPSKG